MQQESCFGTRPKRQEALVALNVRLRAKKLGRQQALASEMSDPRGSRSYNRPAFGGITSGRIQGNMN